MSNPKGPGLYEFLTESELQQYFNSFKNELKVSQVILFLRPYGVLIFYMSLKLKWNFKIKNDYWNYKMIIFF